jgi:hypothetical protein
VLAADFKMPYTWQYSVGFQKQLGKATEIESDLVGWNWYRDTRSHDPNLFYDTTTGYNVDPSLAGRIRRTGRSHISRATGGRIISHCRAASRGAYRATSRAVSPTR